MNEYRPCARCNQNQLITEFTRKKSICNTCDRAYHREYQAQWRLKNGNSERAANRQRYAKNADTIRARKRARYSQNKEKNVARKLAWQKQNPILCRLNTQRRRARLKNNGIFTIAPKDIRWLENSPCFYCGSWQNLTLDHLIPVARGGRHSIGNLVSACQSCNSSKNDRLLSEWKIRKFYADDREPGATIRISHL